ncbi:MAG: energy-coupling factor ABC transporter ATP-binding protein [bacterium]
MTVYAQKNSTQDSAININGLSFKYFGSDNYALHDINLEIKKGEFIGIVGPAGAGKTTLCYAITGLIPHDILGDFEGSVTINGFNTLSYPVYELSKNYGFIFDNPEYQFSQATVEEEIAIGLENRGVDPDLMPEIIRSSLKAVKLEGTEKRSPFELSGGQQQRLAIASMLALKPSILILDEPTSYLDPQGKEEVYSTLKALNKEGMTIILVDQEVELMAPVVNKIAIMYKGSIVNYGAPAQVFSNIKSTIELGLRIPQATELIVKLGKNAEDGNIPLDVDSAVKFIDIYIKKGGT